MMLGYQAFDDERRKRSLHSLLKTAQVGTTMERSTAVKKISYYYQHIAPASLFKYYSDAPKRLDTVKNNKMWYSSPCRFNDVFDCDVSLDEKAIFQRLLSAKQKHTKIRPGSKQWKEIESTVRKGARGFQAEVDKIRGSTAVACLCEQNDSLLMWAHYANNHRGMCVEYDLNKMIQELLVFPVPVLYSNERVSLQGFNEETEYQDAAVFFSRSVTSKSPEWAYEKEWRIIQDDISCGDKWDKNKGGALLDMVPPSAIYLGCAVQPEFEQEVSEYCRASRINLYKMEKDLHLYKLNPKPILEFDT